jgi:lipopolysaccharide transport system ATP-binding protein
LGWDNSTSDELWALKDVSFDVAFGESLGILGPNGAGKTTILKLLSGISYPTRGDIQVRGRMGSLIELGAGFHPEMTGRENVYLNGVIMGMTRRQVKQRFDSIVSFAEVEPFIDTPVKRYSSGMYVRLAFAVAAHIDPAILLVDEVLAVGDIGFRTKCYRRMAEMRNLGTTVVLVSHDIHAIRDTCDRALLMWQGQLVSDGQPDSVISDYLSRMHSSGARELDSSPSDRTDLRQSESMRARITEVIFNDRDGRPVAALESGDLLAVEVRYFAEESILDPIFRVDFYRDGRLYTGYSSAYDKVPVSGLTGHGKVTLALTNLFLPPGIYSVSIVIAETYEYNLVDVHHQAYPLQILRAPDSRGDVILPHTWLFQGQRFHSED